MRLSLVLLALALPALAGDPPGIFVAVGYGGRRISSHDGLAWEHDQRWSDAAIDDDNVLFDVTFGAGKFVAVGGGPKIGHLLTTCDGRTWKALPQAASRVATISFGNGRFIAAQDSQLLVSVNGERFENGARFDFPGSIHARRSACGDTEAGFRTVIIGDVDLWAEKKRISWRATTGDGTRFEHSAFETPPARDVAYGSGHFVIVGAGGLIESSHDGQTWRRHEVGVTDEFSRVIWTGQRFVISGGQRAWTSPDALKWTAEPHRIPCSLAWAREGWLGIGLSWGGNIHRSSDLVTWKKVALPPGPSLEAVVWGAP